MSALLHLAVVVLAVTAPHTGQPLRPTPEQAVIQLQVLPDVPEPDPELPALLPRPPAVPAPPIAVPDVVLAARPPATQAAPPAPTAEEWAFASTYRLKNSKGYRYTWGQQVRSMMGTAVEGSDQGLVRFRVEIAPDGALARLDTLWSTSPVAERLARQAIGSLPRWPPTPTGRPLVFEKTIAFTPFASDGPPIYQDDCLPDPPAFSNPFVWDGRSEPARAQAKAVDKPDPQALADCLRQLPQDSIEAESARDQRLMDQWGWSASRLGR